MGRVALPSFGLLQKSLSIKLCLLLGLPILVGIVLFALYFLHYQAEALRESARNELIDLSGIVTRNTRRSMQSNYPEGIEDIIKTAGEQKNILAVWIYNRSGKVSFASNPAAIGLTVGENAPSCTVCHAEGGADIPSSERERVFTTTYEGRRALSIVSPILGEQGCYQATCHHHPPEHALLGILEIYRSLDDVQRVVTSNVRHVVIFGLVLFVFISSMTLFFVVRFVHRPVRTLVDSAVRLSGGDYGLQAAVPGEDELGQLTMAFNEMSRKIEERQSKLFKSREEFRILFNEVPADIVVLERDYTIRNANRAYSDRYGDDTGLRCFEAHTLRDEPCEECPARKTFSDGEVHSLERVRKLPDGKQHTFLVHTAPIRDEAGRIDAVMEISTDVTGIKELQKELVFLGETVAGISHTIKNILGGLEGGMYVVDMALNKDNEELLRKGWEMVRGNVARVSGLVRDILFMSKERVPELMDTDPAEVCREVLALLKGKATEAGVHMELRAPQEARTIRVDPNGLHTVLVNLLSNAIDACRSRKATSQVHHVVVTYDYEDAQGILFEVADDGPGMSPETKEILFRSFFSTKGSAGTGLGLLVTKKIVEEHGGRIAFESEVGRGTVFTVRLPTQHAPKAPDNRA